ncbi:CPBP family intramembrane metalloprotease [Vagococcus fluvialis]|jgi:membrane protease YdiL (CAAX protease family)|uniref:CPBP family intramembrane glutamic endopeptidase n=1 Tax=Vagococcus fluvialis TaxID=2738 RepID=UPI001A8CB7B0|nr:type II CAAX endopeptidase family protein [Vagococcus fluvialis]MBO0428984.1 CPBP family intramembrane metalloprotease [Vagococcus fluvialis]
MDTKKESKLVYVKYLFFLFLFFLLSSIPDIVMAILIGLDFSDWLIMVIILCLNGLIIRFVYKKYLSKTKDNSFENENLEEFKWKKILFVLVMYGIMYLIDLLFSTFLDIGTPENQEILEEMFRMTPITIAMMTVVVAPIVEELIFRGLFTTYFMKNETVLSKIVIVVTSSLVFGLAHEVTPSLSLLYYSSIGAMLSITYMYTKNIKYSILLHFINNLLATYMMFTS